MRRPLPPIWLAAPSRYAAATRGQARRVLIALAALLVVTLLALATPDPAGASAAATGGSSDVALYRAIVDGMRGGGAYYPVAAAALREGGYPLKPFVTFRLPTLAVIETALPAKAVVALLYALALAMALAWLMRLRVALRPPLAVATALVLLGAGSLACWQAALVGFHEVWAGQLVALSLARWRPGRWAEAVGWGLVAAVIRETAALYLLVMAALAWRDGDRRQVLGWAAAMAVLALLLVAHAHGVAQVVRAGDPSSPGWAGLLGPGFAVRATWSSTAIAALPLLVAAPLIGLAWWGWTAWADPLGGRVAAVIAAYAVLLAVAGRLDTFYWGLMTAPVSLIGLAFAPDGVRDLIASARDRRRITVRRVSL